MNVVDVGLVREVVVAGDELHVTMTMTSAACPVADLIVDDVVDELEAALPAPMAVDVRLVWEPPWTPERMSEAAKLQLGMF